MVNLLLWLRRFGSLRFYVHGLREGFRLRWRFELSSNQISERPIHGYVRNDVHSQIQHPSFDQQPCGLFSAFFSFLFLVVSADSLFSLLFVMESTDAQGNISPADIRSSPAATSRLLKGDRRAGLLLLGRNGRQRFKDHAHLALPNNRYANDDHPRSERGVGCTRNGGNDTQGCKQYVTCRRIKEFACAMIR